MAPRLLDRLLLLASSTLPPCRAAGSMVAEPLPEASLAYCLFHRVNLNDPATWSQVGDLEEAVRGAVSSYLGADIGGLLPTGGGSENVLSALYAAREANGGRLVLAGAGLHASAEKAARLLGLRVVKAPAAAPGGATAPGGFEDAARRLRGERVAAVLATAGTTETGYVEPLAEALEAAAELGAVLYVDAAWGWLSVPGALGRLLSSGSPVLVGIDFHKHVAPPPSAALLASHGALLDPLVFEAPYMPAGRQRGLPWTRSAAGLAAAAAALEALGPRGLGELARRLEGLASRLASLLRAAGVEVWSRPWTPLVAFRAPRGAVERLRRRGWVLYPTASPGGLRYVAKWCHSVGDVEEIAGLVVGVA